MSIKLKILTILTTVLVIVDQLTKLWTVRALRYSGQNLPAHTWDGIKQLGYDPANPEEISIIPGFLSFIHAQNPGAAMGMLVTFEHRMWVFLAFTIVAVGVLISMYRQLPDNDRFQSATIALILSGAVGNAIDRVHKQTVTDFIRVYTDAPAAKAWLLDTFRTAEWPTFNIADAAIVVGVGMYLVQYLVFERDKDIGNAGKSPLDEPEGTPGTPPGAAT
ncbi:MAG: signal peptidase II [Pseudomonadota bacterium]|nr:signal peptidase II [Pseudomonadota bacterium]